MRHHVGFESLWSMRIPVPYSLLLRDRDLAWSCGQCPLDVDGEVLHTGDPGAQAKVVAAYLVSVIEMGGMTPADLAMIVLYHDADEPETLVDILRASAPEAVFAPVRVPEFYYPGMRLELDAFADRDPARGLRYSTANSRIAAETGRARIIEHWVTPSLDDRLPPTAIVDSAATTVSMWAVDAPAAADARVIESAGVAVTLRQAGGLASLTAVAPRRHGLIAQTEALMDAFATVLAGEGWGFGDVVKSTTHYVGEPTPEDLHNNMQVRNRRYRSPGPASTGIRVRGLNAAGALTAVSLLIVTP